MINVQKGSQDLFLVSVEGSGPQDEYARACISKLLRTRERRSLDGTRVHWELPVHEFLELKRLLDASNFFEDRYIDDSAGATLDSFLLQQTLIDVVRAGGAEHLVNWDVFPTLPYRDQRCAIQFLACQERSLDADEMGLGKSLCTLYADRLWRQRGLVQRTLVVCPNSVKTAWRSQIEKHCPDSSWTVVGNGSLRVLEDLESYSLRPTDFLVVHYDCLVTKRTKQTSSLLSAAIERLVSMNFDSVIIDEAHLIKDPFSLRSKAVREGLIKRLSPLVKDFVEVSVQLENGTVLKFLLSATRAASLQIREGRELELATFI